MEFTADLAPFSETLTISLYSDGVAEGEEGFVVLLGVFQDDLDDGDKNAVEVEDQVVLVRLLDGSKRVCTLTFTGCLTCLPFEQTLGLGS